MIKLGLKSAVSMLVLAMLFGGANRAMAQYQEGDLNHDGIIDVADLTQIIDMMANGGGMITPLPEQRREFRKFRPDSIEPVREIDLGLPSHRKWASKNIGAGRVYDFGVFFAWGEVEGRYGYLPERLNPSLLEKGTTPRKFDWPSYEFNWGNNSWETIEKYQYPDNHSEGTVWYDDFGLYNGDNRFHLEDADDAAKYHWDTSWRMPNYVDIMELIDTTYTTQRWGKFQGTDVYGCIFKSKNPQYTDSLFLPAAGQADDKYVQYRSDMNGFGHCFYWTSDIYQHHTADAYVLDIDKYLPGMDMREGEDKIAIVSWYHRYLGCSIRPVKDDK